MGQDVKVLLERADRVIEVEDFDDLEFSNRLKMGIVKANLGEYGFYTHTTPKGEDVIYVNAELLNKTD